MEETEKPWAVSIITGKIDAFFICEDKAITFAIPP